MSTLKHDTSQFERDLSALGISLTELQLQQFLVYYEMLVEWNQKMNLTAITEYEDVLKKHFIDSLSIVKAWSNREACDFGADTGSFPKAAKVIDVGTGAGFPGLALKIAFPDLQITLLDSLAKRIQFLSAVVEKLGLSGVTAIHGRAEDFAKVENTKKRIANTSDAKNSSEKNPDAKNFSEKTESFREQYDFCVSRAVANLATLSEYCLPFVKVGGQFISYKSEKIMQELKTAEKAISTLGGKIAEQVEFLLPDSDIYRNLIVIEKVKNTPAKYPRKAGIPAREPISFSTK